MPGEFENYDALNPETDLDANERTGLVAIPAFAVFADLAEIGQVEDYDAKWQITFRHPKGSDEAQRFFAVCDHIARKTWKTEADEKLEAIWGCIENGIPPRNSNISIQDGDLNKPEYNSGHWLIKASRRENEGRPALYDTHGAAIYDPINAITTHNGQPDDEPDEEEMVGDENQIVRNGDYCMILMRVWAQAKRERLNFSVEGVRLVKRGAGAKAAGIAQRNEALSMLSGGALPELPESIDEPVAKPAKRAAKKAAPKKKAGKKAAPKKKGSVFRKRGR